MKLRRAHGFDAGCNKNIKIMYTSAETHKNIKGIQKNTAMTEDISNDHMLTRGNP